MTTRTTRWICALVGCWLWMLTTARELPSHAQVGPQLFDAGQERRAIYPAYEGFRRNDDGSLTLSFAYFSHNATPVTIAPGPDNSFGAAGVDIGQPTTFYPGHQRWQCIVVVDPEFDGDLRWTISHAGTTTSTSESMLQYNWEFAASDERNALRDIEDPTATPRDVCLNRPPIVRVLGYGGRRGPNELQVAVGDGLKLFGSVRDEGLPRTGSLVSAWRKVSGPGDVTFDSPDAPRTLAFFSEAGEYELELSGHDSELQNTTHVKVVVSPS